MPKTFYIFCKECVQNYTICNTKEIEGITECRTLAEVSTQGNYSTNHSDSIVMIICVERVSRLKYLSND